EGELAGPHAPVELDALLAARIGVGGEVGQVGLSPDQAASAGAAASPRASARPPTATGGAREIELLVRGAGAGPLLELGAIGGAVARHRHALAALDRLQAEH